MQTIHIQAAWWAFLVGTLIGAGMGLFHHRGDWLGGHGSWPRKMIRLAHIACFGMGGMQLAFAFSIPPENVERFQPTSMALLVALVGMPTICLLSAWKQPFRHGFILPVGSFIYATTSLIHLGGTP